MNEGTAAIFKLTITQAIESMILTSKIQLIGWSPDPRFARALARWKEVWDHSQKVQEFDDQSGFMIHAEEFWLLARKIFKSDVSKLIRTFGTDEMTQVRGWLTELE